MRYCTCLLYTSKPVEDKPNYKFVKGDIADEAFIMDLFEKEKFDVVVNFAAESHVDRSIEDPGIFVQTNVMGTRVLLDASRKFGVKRYHQVSTDEVYGDLPLDRPDLFFTENTPIHTSSPYSASKASADLFVLAYHRTFGTPVKMCIRDRYYTLYYKRKGNVYLREKDVHTYRRTELFNLSRAGGAVRAG